MHKGFLLAGCIFAALAVALGAFGAHSLKKILTEDLQITFETAVRYQLYHAFAMIVTGILYQRFPGKFTKWAGYSFAGGIVFFSGSLYVLCWLKVQHAVGTYSIGMLTPIGGLLFLVGWGLLVAGISKVRMAVKRQ
jgi:uncharacterized membrane protein YgdD (TMEM256/DUF423 family)